GARISPLIAVIVLLIATVLGIPLGVMAGYFGGWLDEVIMRVTDIFLAFPPLLLALAFAAVLPASLTTVIIAIAITWWPWYTRLIRGQAASVAGRPYIEACRALGISRWRIRVRHILPNSITPLLVQISFDVGGVILTASALSFLGLGAQDPTPDWGLMVAEGQGYFTTAWWVVTFPGLAILFTAFTSTCSATGCGTCWIRNGRSCDEARHHRTAGQLRRPARRRPRRPPRRRAARRRGRDRRAGGGERLRQVDDHARRARPGAHGRRHGARQHHAGRHRADRPVPADAAGGARAPDRGHLPEPGDRVQPGVQGRQRGAPRAAAARDGQG